jgi:hypothetical protein
VSLASTIWMAAVAAATMDGMVPDPVNWDQMPRPEPTQGSGVPSAHPDTLPWQGYKWYDPNHTVTKSPDPNRDPGADPPEVGDRSSKFFTLKEVRSAVHRVHGHPMFDTYCFWFTRRCFGVTPGLGREVESRGKQSTVVRPWDAGSGRLSRGPQALWRRPPAPAAEAAGERRGYP